MNCHNNHGYTLKNHVLACWTSVLMCGIMIFSSEVLEAKILVMTHCYNKPEFINWQDSTFKKFLKEDYEFVVFNDAPNDQLFNETVMTCKTLNLTCITVPQIIHAGRNNPSMECADTIQYMMDTLGFDYPGVVVLIDSDMFLIKDLKISDILQNYDIAALPQFKEGEHDTVTYLLPNLIFFNMPACPDRHTLNFDLGFIDGVNTDTAGFTYFYLKDHPDLRWFKTNVYHVLVENMSPLTPEVTDTFKASPKLWDLMTNKKFDYEFYNDFHFLHFRAGSNWNKMEEGQLTEKTKLLSDAIAELINPSSSFL